jgi:exodeoxyribonuclease VII large subunit
MGANYRDSIDRGKPHPVFDARKRHKESGFRSTNSGILPPMADSTADSDGTAPERDIYSVSRLNLEARQLLEQGFPRLWLEGELSNMSRPSSGHLYFTLKDARAQIRAAMFRTRNQAIRFRPEEGLQVLVRARVSLYEPRGDYQLIVEHMEEAGDGALRRAFEELKHRLDAEGLFDAAGKQPLPVLPQRIGVITSPSGAAVRDVISVLRRRFPAIPVLIYPVPVQGKEAGGEIANTIRLASARADCDVLILTRGGGSLEDLWPFNEEVVARAIHDCRIPLVSAVGHEIDFTIADFVADRRAATPSAAAELVVPDQVDWLARLTQSATRLENRLRHTLSDVQRQLAWLKQRLQQVHPGQYLRQQAQRLDELEHRARLMTILRINELKSSLKELHTNLQRHSPSQLLDRYTLQHSLLEHRLGTAIQGLLEGKRRRLELACRSLDNISPLATLQRGYAIVSRLPERRILRQAAAVKAGDRIEAQLANGTLVCTVDTTDTPNNPTGLP